MNASDYKLTDLKKYIAELIGTTVSVTITKQINKFIIAGFSYLEIARCISYWTEEKGGQVNAIYGIWFCDRIRDEAAAHFKKLELEQQKRVAEAKKLVEYQGNNIIFNIKNLKNSARQPKQLDISEINIEGDEEDDG